MKKAILTIILSAITLIQSMAQFEYHEHRSFSFGGPSDPNYGVTINGINKMFILGRNYLTVETNHTMCYIYSSLFHIYFKDNEKGVYNDIQALDVLTSANGEFYDGYIGSSEAMATIRALNPVTYRFKSEESVTADINAAKAIEPTHIGFLAQEMQSTIPHAVAKVDDGLMTINYARVLPVTLGAISDMQSRIEANRAKLQQLQSALNNSTSNTTAQ